MLGWPAGSAHTSRLTGCSQKVYTVQLYNAPRNMVTNTMSTVRRAVGAKSGRGACHTDHAVLSPPAAPAHAPTGTAVQLTQQRRAMSRPPLSQYMVCTMQHRTSMHHGSRRWQIGTPTNRNPHVTADWASATASSEVYGTRTSTSRQWTDTRNSRLADSTPKRRPRARTSRAPPR